MYHISSSLCSPNTGEANEKLEKVFEDLIQEQRLGKKRMFQRQVGHLLKFLDNLAGVTQIE